MIPDTQCTPSVVYQTVHGAALPGDLQEVAQFRLKGGQDIVCHPSG